MTQLAQPVELAQSKPVIALLALATHYILHQGEWDVTFHVVLGTWTAAFSGLAVAEYAYSLQTNTIGAAVKVMTTSTVLYFSVLAASILLHRGFFHRLRKVSKELLTGTVRIANANRCPAHS